MAAIGASHAGTSRGSALHIANSAPIRMAQLHGLDPSIDVFCNRGVNGIDGCLSTAIGYATATGKPTFVIIGDLAFFYDMNSLWIRSLPDNLRILLLNNGGGAVMHVPMPGDYSAAVAGRHVSAEHSMSARGWVESLGIEYSAARDCRFDGHRDRLAHGPERARAEGARGVLGEDRGHRTAEGVLLGRSRRVKPSVLPPDPATRRQGPATTWIAVARVRSAERGGELHAVRRLANRVLARVRRRLTRVEMARPYVVRVDSPPELDGLLRGRDGRKRSHRPGDLAQTGVERSRGVRPRTQNVEARRGRR